MIRILAPREKVLLFVCVFIVSLIPLARRVLAQRATYVLFSLIVFSVIGSGHSDPFPVVLVEHDEGSLCTDGVWPAALANASNNLSDSR